MVSHLSPWKSRKSRVSPMAITHASTIFGKNRAGLRGKSVRVKPARVEIGVVEIPRDFNALHKFITLVGDVMFVDGLPFMLTRSWDISFGTVELLPSRTAPQLGSSLMKVVKLYAMRGFVVQCVLMDMEFESV